MRQQLNDLVLSKTLDRIEKQFPDKEMLTKKDVMAFCKIGYTKCVTEFTFKGGTITKSQLALQLAR